MVCDILATKIGSIYSDGDCIVPVQYLRFENATTMGIQLTRTSLVSLATF